MVFFYDAQGCLLNSKIERVFQGSNKANTIYFVCPTAPSNFINVAFKLPNGDSVPQHLMKLTEETGLTGVFDKNGKIFAMWEYQIPSAITSYKGNVQVQFYITANAGEVLATNTVEFVVEKGVANIEPHQGDTYQEVLNQLIDLSYEYEELKIKDYNTLSNIPITNQDITADGFVPLDNTYYRHIGEDTDSYTKNTVYFFKNNEYKAINGNGTRNYNDLSNAPIINADLDSITPVANTYYLHTGASDTNYKIGEIYFYDGTVYRILLRVRETSNYTRVVAVNHKGNQTWYDVNPETPSPNTIGPRTSRGTITTGTPQQDKDCIPLNYFNANIGHCWKLEVDTGEWYYGKFTYYVNTTANSITDLASDIVSRKVIDGFLIIEPNSVWINDVDYFGPVTTYILSAVVNNNSITLTGNSIIMYVLSTDNAGVNKTAYTTNQLGTATVTKLW